MVQKLLLAWAFLAIAGQGWRLNLHAIVKGEKSESNGQESVAKDNPKKASKAHMALLLASLGQSNALSPGTGLIHRPHTFAAEQGVVHRAAATTSSLEMPEWEAPAWKAPEWEVPAWKAPEWEAPASTAFDSDVGGRIGQPAMMLPTHDRLESTPKQVYSRVPRSAALNAAAARRNSIVSMQEVVSPFSEEDPAQPPSDKGTMALTLENVELVLDEMRPYLLADGGNVEVRSIDGGVVQLELQGACGSCPSSEMTLRMGLERGLREKIPEIIEVEQVKPGGPEMTEDGIETVLDEIRPFLKMAGGDIELLSLEGGMQPTVTMKMTGASATINSVRGEVAQRLRRNFPTLANVKWEGLEDWKQ